MQRREFIRLLGGAAAWPVVAPAQQPSMPVIGFLGSTSSAEWSSYVAAFHRGIAEEGFVEGRNIATEYRWAEGRYEQLALLAKQLVDHHPALIMASGGPLSALAAKKATATIPIVFAIGNDPLALGIVDSLSRPHENVTGIYFILTALATKRLGIMRELLPSVTSIAYLVNPKNPNAEPQRAEISDAARKLAISVELLEARTEAELDAVFTTIVQKRYGALVTSADPFFTSRRSQLVALAARYRVPTMFHLREFVIDGALISYGTDIGKAHHRAGIYAGRILKGAKPSDLPVEQSVTFEFVINLKTARDLGIAVPATLLAQTSEVIE